MAAVQQRSPTDDSLQDSSTEFKGSKFIESMEDEMRRCAEHLERRQSRKIRSLDRKANGYSTGSVSAPNSSSSSSSGYFEGSAEAVAPPRSKSSMSSSAKTLPRSFTLPSEPEERSVLSPRKVPPGRRSPVKSPEKSKARVFRFNSIDVSTSSAHHHHHHHHHHHVRENSDPATAGYHKGGSAPPETSPFFSAGSGSCSRESSVTPLQSPLGRTPIGAVASHSRRSPRSSSSPPPVPPKRVGASPPAVPPKPPSKKHHHQRGGGRKVSPTPRSQHHKVEVTTVCRESLKLSSPPPPLDPITVSKLSAEDKGKSEKKGELLEFPSAEVDLRNFHEKVMRAKSLLQESTGVNVSSVESSVDAEDYNTSTLQQQQPLREQSAPPTLDPSAAAGKLGSWPAKASSTETLSAARQSKAASFEPSPLLEGTESSVDIPARISSGCGLQVPGSKAVSEPSLMACSDHSLEEASLPSVSDACFSDPSLSCRDSELSVEDHPTPSSAGIGESIKEEEEEEIGTEVDKAETKLNEPMTEGEKTAKERTDQAEEKAEEKAQEEAQDVATETGKVGEKDEIEEPLQKLDRLGLSLPNLKSQSPDHQRRAKSSSPQATTPELRVTTPDLQTTLPEVPETPKDNATSTSPPDVRDSNPSLATSAEDSNPETSEQADVAIDSSKDHKDSEVSEDIDVLSMSSTSAQSAALSLASGEACEPEVKSVPLRSRSHGKASGREGGEGGVAGSQHGSPSLAANTPPSQHSRHSHGTKAEKLSNSSQPSPKLISSSEDSQDVESAQVQQISAEVMEGLSEPVRLLIKELQIKLREKEGDVARLERVHEREMKEKDDKIKKLTKEAKKVEREKWELLKRARDAAERSLHLRTQLDMKEGNARSVQGELERTRDELVSVKSANASLRGLLSDLRASTTNSASKTADMGIQVDLNTGSLRRNRSMELAFSQGGLSQDQDRISIGGGGGNFEQNPNNRMSSSSLGLNWPDRSSWGGGDRDVISMDSASLQDESYQPLGSRESRKSRKVSKGAFLSKMKRSSGKRGSRSSMTSADGIDLSQSSLIQGAGRSVSVGSPYQVVPSDLKEHWRVLEENKDTPFSKWGLKAVVAWLEAGLGMGQYSQAVSDKFPSGSALLAVSESDMEKKLGISNPLHRRKLALALKEKNNPRTFQYPHAGRIDHSWVAFEWAHDCGLAHLTEILTANLVDGRVLNSLTKDDLKKYLKIGKKADQLSFLSGVELLRMHDFNREAIEEHRRNTSNPLYWTNRDVADWLYSIDLQDYANNVIGGGVHGALLFLERGRFTADHLASIIQIPSSKGQLKRHLTGKVASLFSEDFGITGSMDPLPPTGAALFSYSPLNLSPAMNNSGSQSPTRTPRSFSPVKTPNLSLGNGSVGGGSGTVTPTDCLHPARRNSLSKRSMQGSPAAIRNNMIRPLAASPPGMKRTGSTPSSMVRATASPLHLQQNQFDTADRARLSLRESALRSMRDDNAPSQHPINRTATPTILSSTTV